MKKGTVLYHSDFTYKDGETGGKKLLIVLNNPNLNIPDPYLLCKTTSQPHPYRPNKFGCHSDKNIYTFRKSDCLDKERTWVQFDGDSLYEYNSTKLLNDKFSGKLKEICNLKENEINAVINCIRLSEDISFYHLELLNRK